MNYACVVCDVRTCCMWSINTGLYMEARELGYQLPLFSRLVPRDTVSP